MEFWEETRVTPPKRVSHSLTRRTTLGTLSFNYWHLLTNVTHIRTKIFSSVYADWSRWLTLTPESTSPWTVAPTLVLPLESIVASHWNVSWRWHRSLSWDQALSSITTLQRSLCQNCSFGKLPNLVPILQDTHGTALEFMMNDKFSQARFWHFLGTHNSKSGSLYCALGYTLSNKKGEQTFTYGQ